MKIDEQQYLDGRVKDQINWYNKKSIINEWPERMVLYAVLTMTKSLLEIESKEESLYGHKAEDSLETIIKALHYYHDPINQSYPEKIESEFLNFSILPIRKMTPGEVYFIQFGSFDGTVGGYRNIQITSLTDGASILKWG